MKCPRCDQPTNVLSTREGDNGQMVRRRKCSQGHRFFTAELVTSAIKDSKTAAPSDRDVAIRNSSLGTGQLARRYGLTAQRIRQILKAPLV